LLTPQQSSPQQAMGNVASYGLICLLLPSNTGAWLCVSKVILKTALSATFIMPEASQGKHSRLYGLPAL